MVSKTESFIQYMVACLVIVLAIGMWIMLIWMLFLPATLSFVKKESRCNYSWAYLCQKTDVK